ncbi:lipopolysaccharide transport periplasmic protein LptA [Thermodesulfobacteriota bacterium]
MRLLSVILTIFLIFSCASAAWSEKTITTSAPIQIEADRMETSQEKNTVLFSGHVRANQGDLIINADAMTVLYSGTGPLQNKQAEIPAEGLSQQIDTITAKGNVEIVQGEWVATGDTMNFNADERIVILLGNARAWQEQNMVSGEKIILYLDEGRSVVERGTVEGERVKAFIYPGSQEENNTDPPQEQ